MNFILDILIKTFCLFVVVIVSTLTGSMLNEIKEKGIKFVDLKVITNFLLGIITIFIIILTINKL